MPINPYVVYRTTRIYSPDAETVGVGWRLRQQGSALSWLANVALGDGGFGALWEEAGVVSTDGDVTRLLRPDGVTYTFEPLTLESFRRIDPVMAAEVDSDWETQSYWAGLFRDLDPQFYSDYLKMGGPTALGFSTESPDELPEWVISQMDEVALTEAEAMPIGRIRSWKSKAHGLRFFQKVAPGKWVMLPDPSKGRSDDDPDRMGSLAWKDSDPSLPTSTADIYTETRPDGSKGYTKERQEKHREILDALFRGKQRSPTPSAVFVMGPPASGKSSTKGRRSEVSRDSVVHIDPDELRAKLPEYEEAVKKRVRNAGSITYAETQTLNNKAVDMAVDGGFDFVMDAAGGTSEAGIDWFKRTIGALKKKGYKVEILLHHTPDIDKLLIRNEERGVRSGRFVPPETIERAAAFVPRHVKEYEDLVDSFTVIDTSGLDDDPPSSPREVYQRSGGKRRVSDPAFAKEHLGVTESVMNTESKNPRIDMSPDAVKERLIQDLVADASHIKSLPVIAKPGEGVTWEPFEPAFNPPGFRYDD